MRYEGNIGEHIEKTAETMVALASDEVANDRREEAVCLFNEIEIRAKPGSNAQDIVAFYMAEMRRRSEAYEASPRRWHNLDIQLGDEGAKANESGGVLNPAALRIG